MTDIRLFLIIPFLGFFILIGGCGQNGSRDENKDPRSSSEKKDKRRNEEKAQKEDPVILFFGNSLTAGKGVEVSEAFPALIQEKLDSLGYPHEVINAGLSGETSAGGKNRVDWVLKGQRVDFFVLELGANDGLRGIDPASTKKNLRAIIEKVRKKKEGVKVYLAGMKVPPNMGKEYGQKFEKIYPELAKEKDLELIPFLLKGVAGEKDLNQPDGIHPTAEGHRIISRTVWKYLKDDLERSVE